MQSALQDDRTGKPGIIAPRTLAQYEAQTTAPDTSIDERLIACAMIHLERGSDIPADIPRRAISIAQWRLDREWTATPERETYVPIRFRDGQLEYKVTPASCTAEEPAGSPAWYRPIRNHSSIAVTAAPIEYTVRRSMPSPQLAIRRTIGAIPRPSGTRLKSAYFRFMTLGDAAEGDILAQFVRPVTEALFIDELDAMDRLAIRNAAQIARAVEEQFRATHNGIPSHLAIGPSAIYTKPRNSAVAPIDHHAGELAAITARQIKRRQSGSGVAAQDWSAILGPVDTELRVSTPAKGRFASVGEGLAAAIYAPKVPLRYMVPLAK